MLEFPPCVGCGYCCKKALCALGSELHGHELPCPSLFEKGGRYWCREAMKSDDVAQALYIGEGCCSSMNSDRQKMLEKKIEIPMLRTEQVLLEMISRSYPNAPRPVFDVGKTTFNSLSQAIQYVNVLSYHGHEQAASDLLRACSRGEL